MGQEYTGIENAAPIAEALVMPAENQAYTYLRATVDQTVIEKEYALVNVPELNIREGKGADFETVGTLERCAISLRIKQTNGSILNREMSGAS